MTDSYPYILTTVRFYKTEEGGRKGATPPTNFRCLFQYGGREFDCLLDLKETGSFSPGQEGVIPIQFLCPDLLVDSLAVGSKFHLREIRVVGEGVVKEIHLTSK